MPARKPSTLKTRHDTKQERSAQTAAESSFTPTTELTVRPPAALFTHKRASATWKRTVGLFFETKGTIITAFDSDVLIKYCLAIEELEELSDLRGQIKELWDTHLSTINNFTPTAENMKDYYNLLNQANALLQRFQGMDARMDGKRKLVFSLAQSLYLTPRSRAGVAPPEKEPDEPKSDMGDLLSDE